MRMKNDELEETKDRLRQLENKYGEVKKDTRTIFNCTNIEASVQFIDDMQKKQQNNKKHGKPVKKQIEIIVQKKKSPVGFP
jgi:hypothetical protein